MSAMCRILLIHCGMPKAGSSTLQEEMRILARRHGRLFSFRHIHPEACDQLAATDESALLTYKNLFAHCHKKGKSCLLSQEALSQKQRSLRVLVELASDYFDRVEVFFLIRDPAVSILSAYQQWGFRDSRISRSINKLIKETGDEESAILLSSKEWFTILSLKRALNNQFISYMIFLNPAELMHSFAKDLHNTGARLSALSFEDTPSGEPLLGSCTRRLGLQGVFSPYLPQNPTVANPSFNPYVVEVIARDRMTGLFQDPSPVLPHDNALVRKFSAALDDEQGSSLVFSDTLAADLEHMYSTAIRPLRDEFDDGIARGDWIRFNQVPTVSQLPSWEQIQDVYRRARKVRQASFASLHRSKLLRAAEIYRELVAD